MKWLNHNINENRYTGSRTKRIGRCCFILRVGAAGLGIRFKKEVRSTIDRIKKYPTAWSMEINEVRRCFVHKFPYKILYSVQEDNVVILAIAHHHRRPGYWIERLKSIG